MIEHREDGRADRGVVRGWRRLERRIVGRASVTGQRATASTGIDRNSPEPSIESRDGRPDFDAMPGVVCVYRRGADGSLQFTYFSAQAEPLLGRTPEALTADPMALVGCVHPDDRELLQ